MFAAQLASSFPTALWARAPLLRRGLRKVTPWVDQLSTRVNAELPLLEAGLSRLDATLSLHTVKARVVAVNDETADVKTYLLRPNARFGSFVPGSYINLRLTIDGKSVQRAYSLSSAPSRGRSAPSGARAESRSAPSGARAESRSARAENGLISITVKRVQGGLVSNWLADNLEVGDVLTLSAPQGQFLLPARPGAALLMISAGSGITPVMSMLRHLLQEQSSAQITFLHFARSSRDIIFERELLEIAARAKNVKVITCVEAADGSWRGPTGRFTHELLESSAPDFRSMDTFLCGPAPFMKAVMQTFERADADLTRLRFESFGVDFQVGAFLEQSHVVRFARSQVESISNRSLTILQEAEARGVAIESGCRAGTCGTCRCTKKSGVIVDIVTGKESGAGEEVIFPCVSMARGVVEVEL